MGARGKDKVLLQPDGSVVSGSTVAGIFNKFLFNFQHLLLILVSSITCSTVVLLIIDLLFF